MVKPTTLTNEKSQPLFSCTLDPKYLNLPFCYSFPRRCNLLGPKFCIVVRWNNLEPSTFHILSNIKKPILPASTSSETQTNTTTLNKYSGFAISRNLKTDGETYICQENVGLSQHSITGYSLFFPPQVTKKEQILFSNAVYLPASESKNNSFYQCIFNRNLTVNDSLGVNQNQKIELQKNTNDTYLPASKKQSGPSVAQNAYDLKNYKYHLIIIEGDWQKQHVNRRMTITNAIGKGVYPQFSQEYLEQIKLRQAYEQSIKNLPDNNNRLISLSNNSSLEKSWRTNYPTVTKVNLGKSKSQILTDSSIEKTSSTQQKMASNGNNKFLDLNSPTTINNNDPNPKNIPNYSNWQNPPQKLEDKSQQQRFFKYLINDKLFLITVSLSLFTLIKVVFTFRHSIFGCSNKEYEPGL